MAPQTNRMENVHDRVSQPLYDTVVVAGAESPIATRKFFSAVQGKAKYLSNLRQNNMLEGKVAFQVREITVDAYVHNNLNRLALPLIMEHSFLKLRVGEKDYLEIPMRLCSGRVHIFEAMAGNTDAAQHFSQLGAPKLRGYKFDGIEQVLIRPVQSFEVEWQCSGMTAAEATAATPAANSKIAFVLALHGSLVRPVQ